MSKAEKVEIDDGQDGEDEEGKKPPKRRRRPPLILRIWNWTLLTLFLLALLVVGIVALLRIVNPPINYYQASEWWRLGQLEREWLPIEVMSPHLPRAAVAAEDANFCLHLGFDVEAIRTAIEEGAQRGASTISQQTAKNVFLWHGRSWVRKGLEAGFTPLIEALWGKERILEVYLNIAEFDTGVFGVEAASRHYFGISARHVEPDQAARLMAILPSPKARSPNALAPWLRQHAGQIRTGAATIVADGRAACFQ
ncbi:MAG: monofunctional biosynthetic peptidoglycan transglycosylase [Pseudomonadota bacterium]